MKKLVLLFTGMLMGLTTVTGTETLSKTQLDDNLSKNKRYHHAQPIMFVERGIEFIIFPNGDFDFNTATDSYGYNDYDDDNMYYRKTNTNTRRGSVTTQVNISAPGTTSRYYNYGPRGIQVIHDRYGNVRRVGHVFINYDYYGRVKRIGSVYVRYHRDRLVQVGGLHLKYNRHGKMIKTYGQVNRHYNHNWNYNNFGWDNNFVWDNYDNDHYYYKKNGKTIKKSKKLKRMIRDDD